MIILESIIVLAGLNVLPENQKIIANWVEFDDITGEQKAAGTQELWMEPKDFKSEQWKGKPADVKAQDLKHWKNLNAQVKAISDNLFNKITKVIEDAVIDGDI